MVLHRRFTNSFPCQESYQIHVLANRIPYIILTRARQCVPKDVEKYKGFPSLITSKLKNISGFTSVTTIHLDGVPCSQEELNELDDLLKGGVII